MTTKLEDAMDGTRFDVIILMLIGLDLGDDDPLAGDAT